MSVLNPSTCTSSSLTHTIALTVMCSYLAPALDLTTWTFSLLSLPINAYFVYLAYRFKMKADAKSSRNLFRYSLIYLPAIILIMLFTKYPYGNEESESDDLKYIKSKMKEHKEYFLNDQLPFQKPK